MLYEEVEEYFKIKGFELLTCDYINQKSLCVFKDDDGYLYEEPFITFKNTVDYFGNKPSFVHTSNKFSIYNIDLWIKKNNKTFTLLPNQQFKGSHSKLYLKCHNCHKNEVPFLMEWNQIQLGADCTLCHGRDVGNYNNLEYLYPNLAKEWDIEKNRIEPNKINPRSNKLVWWKCSKENHSYKSSICGRIRENKGCKYCANNVKYTYGQVFNLMKEKGFILLDDCYLGANEKMNFKDLDGYLYYFSYHRMDCTLKTGGKLERFSVQNPYTMKNIFHFGEINELYCDILSGEFIGTHKSTLMVKCKDCHKERLVSWTALNCSGCLYCRKSKGEKAIEKFLKSNNIIHEREYRGFNCRNIKPLPFDFYLNDFGVLIEFQGEQHYKILPNGIFGNDEDFERRKLHDQIKRDYCYNNNIPLLEIPYWEIKNVEQIIIDFLNNLG